VLVQLSNDDACRNGDTVVTTNGASSMREVRSVVSVRVLDGFDDPTITPDEWNALVRESDTDVVYLTWQFLRTWWRTLGRGQLLLIAAERAGRLVAIAPFYVDTGMVFFVGSGAADYLDFVGDVGDATVLDALLRTAREHAVGFVGFRLYCVLESSRTKSCLQASAARVGLECFEEKRWPAPAIDLADTEGVRASASDHRLAKRESYFSRRGSLMLRQFTDGESIAPHLEAFFEQHISRRAISEPDSQFLDRRRRAFVEQLTREASDTGWLRFSILDWDGRPIAFEFGLAYRGTYFGGPSSAAVDLAKRSPGHVLLGRLLQYALDDGIETYDLGVGDDSYKFLFATRLRHVYTWGLYPSELMGPLVT
jgi:CelD/BcsL family acetyltransferase involved in cellulose biosynthesis